jgi:predicted CoA-substrate-specific enzyme activase
MSCGREIKTLGEGARGRGSLPSPPNPFPQPLMGFGSGEDRRGDPLGRPAGPPPTSACGLDFGSRYVKLVYVAAKGTIGRRRLDTIVFYRDYLRRDNGRLGIDWPRLRLPQPDSLVVTGYGKNLLQKSFPAITEIRAHFLGARQQTGLEHFILLEMGGQDTKVLYVKEGRVFDFLTNDRCAAGTGRYLENMARFLKMPLTQFAAARRDPVEISQTCAIFGESELVGHLLEGVDPERIAAGVNASVARRALAMVRRYRCPTLVCAGGVARNRAVIHFLQEHHLFRVLTPPHPQFNGALGCCLEAARQPALERA